MSPLEYLAEAFADWPLYALLTALSVAAHVPLIRRWAIGVYDPLLLLLLANAFSWAIVWFMFLRGDIAPLYVVSFTVAQLAFYGGMKLGRPRASNASSASASESAFPSASASASAAASASAPASVPAPVRARAPAATPAPATRQDGTVAALALVSATVVHVLSTLAIWQLAGLPLFRESRLGAFEGSGGFGILERVAESSVLILIFATVYLLIHRPRLRRNLLVHGVLAWIVVSVGLSGSKAALLSLGQYGLSIVFVYTALRTSRQRFWGGRAGKWLLVVATVFATGVLAIQSEGGDLVSAGLGLAYRIVSFGDVYIFAYPNATIESITGSNPLIGLFGGFLSTFRLFPQDAVYPNIGYQFTGIVFPGLDLIVGPNPQHPVFGYHYFGPFAFLFSLALGVVTSVVQARFYRRAHTTFVGGLFAFLLYFSLVNISVDFEYTLSKLANLVIGGVLVMGPVLLIAPRAPILRLRPSRRAPPVTARPAG